MNVGSQGEMKKTDFPVRDADDSLLHAAVQSSSEELGTSEIVGLRFGKMK